MNTTYPLSEGCAHCGKPDELKPCNDCNVVLYCCYDHLVAHQYAHRKFCEALKRALDYSNKERIARERFDGVFSQILGSTVLSREDGDGWLTLAATLANAGTRKGVEAGLSNYMQMMRFFNFPPPFTRAQFDHLVPPLLMLLDQDQQCYNFLLQTQVPQPVGHEFYDPEDYTPWIDRLSDQDPFGEIIDFCENPITISTVALIKVKILFDLQRLQATAHAIGPKIPREILDQIRGYVATSPITAGNPNIVREDNHKAKIDLLFKQLDDVLVKLCRTLTYCSRAFKRAAGRPIKMRTLEDRATHGMVTSYGSWKSVPGALLFIKNLMLQAYVNSDTAIAALPPLLDGCNYCRKFGNFLCAACRFVFYCNREHQKADRKAHRAACNMSQMRVRTPTPVMGRTLPVNITWEDACLLRMPETAAYMQARGQWAVATGAIGSVRAAQSALERPMGILREFHCGPEYDPLRIHRLIPMLMLQLDRDQESYDWIKAWSMVSSGDGRTFAGHTKLYTDYGRAGLFEQNCVPFRASEELAMVVYSALIKVKLVVDLRALQITTEAIGPKVSREILDNIRLHIPASPIIADNKTLLHHDDHKQSIHDLLIQTGLIFRLAVPGAQEIVHGIEARFKNDEVEDEE
ncbi:hypothetical protein BJY01DRAFT_252741 [Aspergillus pseudoustus]|uniref:MYND-type domain-containing protein n=1 Tax=Aspergillus pseudoustus TaxID=1810923 RepID=A0ABR4J714_9EURO